MLVFPEKHLLGVFIIKNMAKMVLFGTLFTAFFPIGKKLLAPLCRQIETKLLNLADFTVRSR